jgi:2-amino-4-hydroxy-6-hydroxymethyldihydropteridine diphosphokinase
MNVSTHLRAIAYIGIGSNLDSPLQQVQQAIQSLAQNPDITLLAVSRWYGSKPVGGEPNQADYVNGAACVTTHLNPLELLDRLQHLELAHGRKRLTHWGARTLDLDLLLYNNLILDSARLTLPHPRLHERAFVLRPLVDIAPQLTLPNGVRLASLLDKFCSDGIWLLPSTHANSIPASPPLTQETDCQ